jgi:riboflavin kinase / FMN adenylyltransferase
MDRPASVVTIGGFDGVHRGHAALLAHARDIAARAGARVVALTFDPHPATVLRPDEAPPRLTTFEQRTDLLRGAGADEVVRLEPARALLGQSPEEFVRCLVEQFRPIAIVEGGDFRFGKGRAGDVNVLAELGRRYGFSVGLVDPVEAVLINCTVVRVSSSVTRWLIANGRVRDAAILLGRDYELPGEVVRGDRRGRTIGYPTANVRTPCLLPGDGVYAGTAVLDDGRQFTAAISIGAKPTFAGTERALEAFLIDVPRYGDAIRDLPEYGWKITLRISHWLRDQARYGSVHALLEQMDRDCARARELAGNAMEARA